jgi:hypothetical protein
VKIKTLSVLLLLFTASLVPAYTKKDHSGRTYQSNGSQSDVQAAIDAAPDNGTATVIIPAGTYDWSGTLTIRKAVSLAGNGEVTIRNENGSSNLIDARSGKNGNIEIYGLKFLAVADNGGGKGFDIAAGRDESTRHTVLVHDCHFEQGSIYAYSMECVTNGIIVWSSSFVGSGANGVGGISFVCGWDYKSYNRPSTLGTRDPDGLHNCYVEDCHFANGATGMSNFDANSRVVWRHNRHQDAQLGSHGQETSPIGVTSWEVYDNSFRITKDNPFNLQCWVHIRGGTGVITRNDIDEVPFNKSQFILTIFSITRGANDGKGGSFCPIEYPAPRQTGWSWADNGANWGKVVDKQNPQLLEGGKSPGYFLPNGKGAILDPVYIWDNTGPGTQARGYVWAQTYVPDNCGNNQVIETYLQKGRDYFVNAGPKPGWTPYPYPHPMRSGGGGGPTPTPTPVPTPMPTHRSVRHPRTG